MARNPGLVAVLAYEGLCTFEFGIAVEIFGLPRVDLSPWYRFAVVGLDPSPMRAVGGVTVAASATLRKLAEAKTIVIPGWRDPHEIPPAALLEALRKAYARGARLMSICSGAFVLAATGLLDNRRATTHWSYARDLAAMYPGIQVDADVLYVDEGRIITSAGSAAGIDACLHLVSRDFGAHVANTIARSLVMAPHRTGGQAQFIETPVPQTTGADLGKAMEWARKNISKPIRVRDFAQRAFMSERTFLRRFVGSTGLTPNVWLQQERVARAKEMLESTRHSLGRISELCGYRSVETFRVAFRTHVGVPPGTYRDRFHKAE